MYANKAYRTLTLGYKEMSRDEFDGLDLEDPNVEDVLENELTLLAIFGIKDPLRPEIIESMEQCRTAGVNVRMVTGDNIDTARAIAYDANILEKHIPRD